MVYYLIFFRLDILGSSRPVIVFSYFVLGSLEYWLVTGCLIHVYHVILYFSKIRTFCFNKTRFTFWHVNLKSRCTIEVSTLFSIISRKMYIFLNVARIAQNKISKNVHRKFYYRSLPSLTKKDNFFYIIFVIDCKCHKWILSISLIPKFR